MIKRMCFLCVICLGFAILTMRASYAADSDYSGDNIKIRSIKVGGILTPCPTYDNDKKIFICNGTAEDAVPHQKFKVSKDDPSGVLYVYKCKEGFLCTPVDSAVYYSVAKVTIDSIPHEHDGFTTGALTVPFKYFPSSKHLTSSVNVGPFVGYTWEYLWGTQFAVTPLVTMGITSLNVQSVNSGATSSTNLAGIGWSTGLIVTLEKRNGFQMGLLYGRDYVGANSGVTYAYDGLPWLGFALGFQFTN